MALYGIGLAAEALSKALAQAPEASLAIEANMPEFQGNVLKNIAAQSALEEARLNQPLNRLKRQAEIDTLQAKMPWIGDLAQAEVMGKLAEVPHKQAQTAKLLSEAETLGFETTADAKGNYNVIDKRLGSPNFGKIIASGSEPETLEDLLKQEKLVGEIGKLEVEAPHIAAQTGKLQAETGQIGEMTPLQKYLKSIGWYDRLLKAKEDAANRVHANQVSKLDVERRNRYQQIVDDARAEVSRALSNELGKVQIPGKSIEEQNAIVNYLVNSQTAKMVQDWNQIFGKELPLPVPTILPKPEWDQYLKVQPEKPKWWQMFGKIGMTTPTTKPVLPPAQLKERYKATFGSDADADAASAGIPVDTLLNDPEVMNLLGVE